MTNETIRLQPLTGSVGVSLTGIDLTADITEAGADALRSALYNNCVLILRDQFLSPDDHMRLAAVFGEPFLPWYYAKNSLDSYPKIAIVPNFGKAKAPAESWHTDWSHMPTPPTVSVALAHVLPETGGDTMFSNQYVAYDRLSEGMKKLIAGRRAKFVGSRPKRVQKMHGRPDTHPSTEPEPGDNNPPIARVHPETGRTALYLNRPGKSMVAIEGLTEAESLPILQFLYDQSSTPDNVYRHQWRPGDVVCWDNQCAMHYGVHDYGDAERTLHRITVGGVE
ncbi:MAG: TauD/TfdA family dioxygenase [Acidimicrobiaceae bacterium]|nr:TauD/TfdA family dioxygenase [Acidimicrobiaceae bacterium]